MKAEFSLWKSRMRRWFDRVVEQRWFDVGLRAKMALIVIIGLVGLLTIFALLGIRTARQTTQQILSERVMLARLSATALDASLRHVADMLYLMADQPVLTDPETGQSERQAALQQAGFTNLGVFYFDKDGKLQAASSTDMLDVEWLQVLALKNALSGQKFNLSVVMRSDNLGAASQQTTRDLQPLALIAVPVHNDAGQHVGALGALVDLGNTNLFNIEQPFNLGSTIVLDVVNASGMVLISTSSERLLQDSNQEQIVSRLFVAGEPGVETCLGCYENETSPSRDEVIAFAPLRQVPWGVVVRQKAEEVFSPVRRLTLFTLALGAAAMVGAMGLVWVTTSSVINPVQQLTEGARRIAGGDLDTPLDLNKSSSKNGSKRRRDEVGALAESFVIMRKQLKRSMDEIQALNRDLDARVQERTQAALTAQLEAQSARDDLRAVIDALSDELVVIGVDDLRVQQVNKAALSRKLACEEPIGEPCYKVFHEGNPCSPPNCECPIPIVLKTGESVKVTHVHRCENSGELSYLDIVASPMRDASGRITRIVELSRDVTEEKKIKDSLVRRNQQLSIINAVAITVNQSLDLEDILNRALNEVMNLTEIDAGAVFLQEDAIGDLKLVAYRGLSEDAAKLASQMGMLDGGCGGIIEAGQVIIIPDLSRYRGKRARSLQRDHLSTLVHVPLMVKGCTFGSMCVGTRLHREFSSEEQELLTAIGSQIAVAIENARLYAEVQHKEHVRGELFKKALTAQEEERKRIARELHDDTSQAVAALLFSAEEGLEMNDLVEVKSRLSCMRELAQRTLDGVHKLIFDLRPSVLDHLGLMPALRWLADSRLEPKGIRVQVEADSPPRRLPSEVETALFRVVQEAITNIARHSAARNVSISFHFEDSGIRVQVADDGIGFNLDELSTSPDTLRGLGLMGMVERVELLGGQLEINSLPGSGTLITIRVPIKERTQIYA